MVDSSLSPVFNDQQRSIYLRLIFVQFCTMVEVVPRMRVFNPIKRRVAYCKQQNSKSENVVAASLLKWPLIIDFATSSGSLIVTGVPTWLHLYRITARCRELLLDCCSRRFLLVFVPEIQLSPRRY